MLVLPSELLALLMMVYLLHQKAFLLDPSHLNLALTVAPSFVASVEDHEHQHCDLSKSKSDNLASNNTQYQLHEIETLHSNLLTRILSFVIEKIMFPLIVLPLPAEDMGIT